MPLLSFFEIKKNIINYINFYFPDDTQNIIKYIIFYDSFKKNNPLKRRTQKGLTQKQVSGNLVSHSLNTQNETGETDPTKYLSKLAKIKM